MLHPLHTSVIFKIIKLSPTTHLFSRVKSECSPRIDVHDFVKVFQGCSFNTSFQNNTSIVYLKSATYGQVVLDRKERSLMPKISYAPKNGLPKCLTSQSVLLLYQEESLCLPPSQDHLEQEEPSKNCSKQDIR